MSKKTKSIINIYSIADYQYLETYFEKMAKKGWLIQNISSILTFKRIKPQNLKFSIKIYNGNGTLQNGSKPNLEEYRNLAKESEWNYITSFHNMQVFYSSQDEISQPLMSDPEIEYKAVRKSILRFMLVISLAFIAFAFSSILDLFFTGYSQLLTNKDIAFAIYTAIIGFALIILLLKDIPWLIKARICVKKNTDLPKRKKWLTKYSRFFFVFLFVTSVAVVFISTSLENSMKTLSFEASNVVTLNEFNQNIPYEKIIPYKAYSSFFVPNSYFYMEKATDKDEPYIYNKFYEAKNSKIADKLINHELSESEKDGRTIFKADNPTVWNADEVYYINDDHSFILIKVENRVLVLKGSFDFSDKEMIEICKKQLGLE